MQASEFIAKLAPLAVSEQRRTGVLASVTIAQAVLESGWGGAAPGNNLFGIKGTGQELTTKEYVNGHFVTVTDGFRVYDTWEGSVIDHSNFLVQNSRYRKAGFFDRCAALDFVGAAKALQAAGYATDPGYASKLVSIIENNDLHKFDYVEEAEDMPKLDPGVAQTLIDTFLKPEWHGAEAAKEGAPPETVSELEKQQRYYKWLADSLRDAAGLPRE